MNFGWVSVGGSPRVGDMCIWFSLICAKCLGMLGAASPGIAPSFYDGFVITASFTRDAIFCDTKASKARVMSYVVFGSVTREDMCEIDKEER